MGTFSRRAFLKALPPTIAVAGSVAIPVAVEAAQPMTAQERFDLHLAELKKAAEELDPRIGYWNIRVADEDGLQCALIVTAFRATGFYEGDGIYECSTANFNGSRTKYTVRLLPEKFDGKRAFQVNTLSNSDRMTMIEPRLNTFIGRKIGPLEI